MLWLVYPPFLQGGVHSYLILTKAKVLKALNTRSTYSVKRISLRQSNGSPKESSPIKSKVVQIYYSNRSTGFKLEVSTLTRNLLINCSVKCCRMSCCFRRALSEKVGRRVRRTLLWASSSEVRIEWTPFIAG